MKKTTYKEPIGFFPESVRKKNKIGEYAEDTKKPAKKTVKKSK